MHPSSIYRKAGHEENVDYVRSRAFGVLVLNHEPVPLASHIPFLLSECGTYLEAHLMKVNPIVDLLVDKPKTAKLIVSGGDTYISPDWYETFDQVPTWNYVAVHLTGRVELLDASELIGVLSRLSAQFENRLLPKSPWTLDKLTESTLSKFSRVIVPIVMYIGSVEGTWKLAQNKTDDARIGAAYGAAAANIGAEVAWIARKMRDVKEDTQ